jgi:hypothetical protein
MPFSPRSISVNSVAAIVLSATLLVLFAPTSSRAQSSPRPLLPGNSLTLHSRAAPLTLVACDMEQDIVCVHNSCDHMDPNNYSAYQACLARCDKAAGCRRQ